jgi:DNA-binding response OmpR family regulator
VASLPESEDTLYAGELEIRLGDGLVLAAGRVVRLSVREFELLVAMARRTGAIATREEVFASVWGGSLRPGDRSVDVYVSKLRGKLEAAMPDRRFITPTRASATASSRRPRAERDRVRSRPRAASPGT